MAYRRAAKESVGLYETWRLGGGKFAGVIDLTGWTFKATFERYAADPQAFTLDMAASAEAQGFRIWDGPARQITCRILPATLQSIADTTGDFQMAADVLATPPDSNRFSAFDLELRVVRGPTA